MPRSRAGRCSPGGTCSSRSRWRSRCAKREELVDIAERANRVLMVGHLLWYHPAVVKLKALIDDGRAGPHPVHLLEPPQPRADPARGKHPLVVRAARHLRDPRPGSARCRTPSTRSGGNYLREQIADVTVSVLAFPSGVKAHIFVSWLHPYKEQKLIVVGDRKMAVFNDMEAQDKLLLYPHTINWTNQLPVPLQGRGAGGPDREQRTAARRMPALPGVRPDPADAENGWPGSDSCADGAGRMSARPRGRRRRRRRARPRRRGRSIPSTRRRSSTTMSRSARGPPSGTCRT